VSVAAEAAAAALAAADGEEAEAVVLAERSGLARFASSEVHQPTLIENVVVTLRIVRDGKVGVAVTNKVDEDGLASLVDRARAAADSAVAEPTFPGLAEPAELPDADGYDEATAAQSPEEQAQLAAAAIDAAEGLDAYGFYTSGVTELAVRSSTGVETHQVVTDATALVLAAGEGISGYAEQCAWRAADVDPAAVVGDSPPQVPVAHDNLDLERPGACVFAYVDDGLADGAVGDLLDNIGVALVGHRDPDREPRLLAGLDTQQLLSVVPLIQRLCLVEALVALQPHQFAAAGPGKRLRQLGLADAGRALDQDRLV